MQTGINHMLIATAIAWQLALPVQAQTASLPAGVVATVNGTSITEADIDAELKISEPSEMLAIRQMSKSRLIILMLIYQAADKANYGSRPEVQRTEQIAELDYGGKPEAQAVIKLAKMNAEAQLYLRDNVRSAPVTDAQVKARYDETVALLGKEDIKSRIIVTKDAATAAIVLAELKSGKPFDVLARQYSQAPSAAVGGELPWVSFKMPVTEGKTQGLPLAVAQAISQLPAGGVTPQSIALGNDVNGPRAIVKVDAKRLTQVPSFDAAKATIQQQLQALALEKSTANFVGGLMKGATIQQ